MDQEGEEMATGAYNLANAISRQMGDLIKAEGLARECLRIRSLIYDSNHFDVALSCCLLSRVLTQQIKLGDETKGLLERSLAIFLRNGGPNGSDTANGYLSLGVFHHQLADIQATYTDIDVHVLLKQLLVAKAHFEEAIRIRSKIFGPTHPQTVIAVSQLNNVSSELSTISLP
jgi:tetratricopeptide (TPR) repeat protein